MRGHPLLSRLLVVLRLLLLLLRCLIRLLLLLRLVVGLLLLLRPVIGPLRLLLLGVGVVGRLLARRPVVGRRLLLPRRARWPRLTRPVMRRPTMGRGPMRLLRGCSTRLLLRCPLRLLLRVPERWLLTDVGCLLVHHRGLDHPVVGRWLLFWARSRTPTWQTRNTRRSSGARRPDRLLFRRLPQRPRDLFLDQSLDLLRGQAALRWRREGHRPHLLRQRAGPDSEQRSCPVATLLTDRQHLASEILALSLSHLLRVEGLARGQRDDEPEREHDQHAQHRRYDRARGERTRRVLRRNH